MYPRLASDDLRALGSCASDRRTFNKMFPTGAIPRADVVEKALLSDMDVLWIVDRIRDEIPAARADAIALFEYDDIWWNTCKKVGPMTDHERHWYATYMAPRTAAFLRRWLPQLLESVR